MKSRSVVIYRFDLKSVFLVPLLAFIISLISVVAVVQLAGNPKVGKITENQSVAKGSSNILNYIVHL